MGDASRGIIVPKFRGDLVACAAVGRAMHDAQVESTDIRAIRWTSSRNRSSRWCRPWTVEGGRPVRRACAAPRRSPSSAASDVRRRARHAVGPLSVGRVRRSAAAPDLGSDRTTRVTAARRREAHRRRPTAARFPIAGSTASSWLGAARPGRARRRARRRDGVREPRRRDVPARRLELAHRANHPRPRRWCRLPRASPARCRSGRRDSIGRPLELGRAVGALVRTLVAHAAGRRRSSASSSSTTSTHRPPKICLRYLAEQIAAAGVVPDDRTVVIERCRDELGDWRVCVLSPFGSRIHAPWAMAVVERVRAEVGPRRRDDVDRRRVRGAGSRRPTTRRIRG